MCHHEQTIEEVVEVVVEKITVLMKIKNKLMMAVEGTVHSVHRVHCSSLSSVH